MIKNKLSVFTARSSNVNATYPNIINGLASTGADDIKVCDVTDLTTGEVRKIIDRSSPIVVDHAIVMAKVFDRDKLLMVEFPRWCGSEHYSSVYNLLLSATMRRVYMACGWDLHWTGADLDTLLPRIDALIWLFEKRPMSKADTNQSYRDDWMANHDDPLANWAKVTGSVRSRFELTHCLADEEIAPARRKIWDFCVPGDDYGPRRAALAGILEAGLSVAPFAISDRRIFCLSALLKDRLHLSAGLIRPWLIRVRQWNQKRLIAGSRMTFVCGSEYRYPVRKFLEIPACQSTMVAYPCTGMADLGFRAWVDYVPVEPKATREICAPILADEAKLDRMRRSALGVVRSLHSVDKRTRDLIHFLRLVNQGDSVAQFKGGEFAFATS